LQNYEKNPKKPKEIGDKTPFLPKISKNPNKKL
jgi:hypothetical protein